MRRKKFGQVTRFALAMTMIGFLVFDTSMAGCLNRYLNRRNCQPAPVCCVEVCCPQPVVCCPPPIHCQPVCPPVDCCGSAPIIYSQPGCIEGTVVGTPVHGSTVSETVVGVPTEATDHAVDSHHEADPTPTVADTDSEADDASAFEDMGDDAGAAGADTASDDSSTEDILPPDAIDDGDAASDGADEIFGATPDDADTGTDAADSADDGGFEDSGFDDADDAFGDTADDGFGDDAAMDDASATTDDAGGFEDASDPVGGTADEDEDIFGGDDFGGADDFGTGDDADTTDDGGFDDVLDGDALDDDADLDAIFDDGAKVDRVRDGFREVIPVAARRSTDLPFRLWTDNTGEYRTVGRLVQITKTHVRMLKDNGKHSTVAKTRLSKADLKYAAEMESVLGLRNNFDAIALR